MRIDCKQNAVDHCVNSETMAKPKTVLSRAQSSSLWISSQSWTPLWQRPGLRVLTVLTSVQSALSSDVSERARTHV